MPCQGAARPRRLPVAFFSPRYHESWAGRAGAPAGRVRVVRTLGHNPAVVDDLSELLRRVSARHRHLCPRQVLGVRIALAGAAALGVALPHAGRRLLVYVESDGCFADGVEVASGATIGRRTLRVMDYGKVAATFVDVSGGAALRVWPQAGIRERVRAHAPDEARRYYAQLRGYQVMPDEELLHIRPVRLLTPVERVLSRARHRVVCDRCGEEILNEREIRREGQVLCASCAGLGYYEEK